MVHAFAMLLLVGTLTIFGGLQAAPVDGAETDVRFEVIQVRINASQPLAAYQCSIQARDPRVRIVGIEGGADEVFAEPPHYDDRAMRGERVIIAAFTNADADTLPTGDVRVASIHLQVPADAPLATDGRFNVSLDVAATAGGTPIDATITLTTQ